MAASSKRMGNLSSTFEKADSAYNISALPARRQKEAAIMRPMQTRIYQKKYVNGSENSKGHKKQTIKGCYTYTGLDLSIYVIKSPTQLVRQSL
jgi:hypothetical protein